MAVYTAIDDAGSFFSPVLYTGTGSSLAITGVGFQPDFTWIKNRDAPDFSVLTDAVRGATKYLISDAVTAETTDTETLKSFDSDGFTVGTTVQVNTNTEDYASWNWKAGTTTGLSGGTITPSSYSINATSGFGIYKYTGTGSAGTIAHGLGAVPRFILFKNLGTTDNWSGYHVSVGATKQLTLDSTEAAGTTSTPFNDTEPTSTVFTVGSSGRTNTSSDTYIAYCFADVQGYSKFGGYTGNGDTDGAFVYTGFRPAFIIIKRTSAIGDWMIFDDKRLGYNVDNDRLMANDTGVESTTDYGDIVSNGFKLRNSGTYENGSGSTYIFMAFARSPFVNSNSAPVNAR